MIKVLVLADDVTGALDTGVKFSQEGLKTRVLLQTEWDRIPQECDVLVLCLPTRHMKPDAAYTLVRDVARRAAEMNIGCIFKKTDSALRGNVGAELSAVLDGSGETLLTFIPALPWMHRITKNGIHYIDGVPVHESVFGQDPFEPVCESYIPDLLARQCGEEINILSCTLPPTQMSQQKTLAVLDCSSKEEMRAQLRELSGRPVRKILAGCSGLAEALAEELAVPGRQTECADNEQGLTVICGSVNPISRGQASYAVQNGYAHFQIPVERLLSAGGLNSPDCRKLMDELWQRYCDSERLLIDTVQQGNTEDLENFQTMRHDVALLLGCIMRELLDRGACSRLMIIGGDTLLGFMEAIGCRELIPVAELLPGVVEALVTYRGREYTVLSKSGGFGNEKILLSLPTKRRVNA